MSEDNKSDKSITRRSGKIGSPRIACFLWSSARCLMRRIGLGGSLNRKSALPTNHLAGIIFRVSVIYLYLLSVSTPFSM